MTISNYYLTLKKQVTLNENSQVINNPNCCFFFQMRKAPKTVLVSKIWNKRTPRLPDISYKNSLWLEHFGAIEYLMYCAHKQR